MSTKLMAALSVSGVLFSASFAHAQAPPPWKSADVGNVGTPGHITVGSAIDWHISGAGSDIWGSADSFFYVYQPIRDSYTYLTVKSETDTSPFAKLGVMIRQTLDPDSPEVIVDIKPDGGVEFMTRSVKGGETHFIAGGSVPASIDSNGTAQIDASIDLQRLGSTVFARYCVSGTCTSLGSTSFPEGPALTGVAVTSHDPARLNDAYMQPPLMFSVPGSWSSSDVGDVGTPGMAAFEDATGTFYVSGAGSDIWGTADSFHSVYQAMYGDSQLTTRLVREDNTNAFAKAGLTISTDTSADAPRVILDVKPDGGVEFMARPAKAAAMTFIAGSTATFPAWLRLTRTGDQFVGEISNDGAAWTTVGSVSVSMPTNDILRGIVGGLAVTSHAPGVLNTAVFDNVGVNTGLPPFVGPNLLANPGFEESSVPTVGPGWVSDTPLRQTPAVTETSSPHAGAQNAACHTTSGDCGIYQDVEGGSGNMIVSFYARADHPGTLVGVNVDGIPGAVMRVSPGGYQRYSSWFTTFYVAPNSTHPVIRVWMYSPGAPGVVEIDDVELVQYNGPR